MSGSGEGGVSVRRRAGQGSVYVLSSNYHFFRLSNGPDFQEFALLELRSLELPLEL